MSARIYALRPKMTQSEAHDYVSARHRVYISAKHRVEDSRDFDPKTWWHGLAWFYFWLGIVGVFMGILKYLTQT